MAISSRHGVLVLCLFLWCSFPLRTASRRSQRCWSTFQIHGSSSARRGPCCDNMCKCDKTTVDCSFSNLTYIPHMDDSVTFLNLSNNHLGKLIDPVFFVNVSKNVSALDLYNNDLTHIEPGVFRYMFKLKRVFLGGNDLTYDQVAHVLTVPRLKGLELKCGRLGNVPENIFANYSHFELRYLDMSWNSLEVLDMKQFQPLQRLASLLVRHNQIRNIRSAYHPFLKMWVMHHNKMSSFPVTCDENGMSFYPNVTVLDLNSNYISDLPSRICLPSLTKLSMSYNTFAYFSQNMFSMQRFPMLRQLNVTQMRAKIIGVEAFTFNNSNIDSLDFGYNPLDFSSDSVSIDVFQGCDSLKKLYLDRAKFEFVDDERFQRLFDPVKSSMEILYLGMTKLRLREDTFKNWTRLRQLYLYDNGLRAVPDGIFDHLENLSILKLDSNQITTVPESAFSEATRNRLKKIDLSGNPFSCDCGIRHLQQWMGRQLHKFLNFRRKKYKCYGMRNTTVQNFSLPDQACLLAPSTSVLISVIVLILIFSLVLVMALWYFRWHLYLRFYEFPRRDVQDAAGRGQYLFHVFVAYDENDGRWVHDTLRPVLEETWGLKVCLHLRDFQAGRQELECTNEYLPGSHSILVVFSPNFASDTWRQFELGLCLTQSVTTPCPLVPVCLPGWRSRVTTSMLTVLRAVKVHLEWTDAEGEEGHLRANRFFWKNLRKCLSGAIKTAQEERWKKRQ